MDLGFKVGYKNFLSSRSFDFFEYEPKDRTASSMLCFKNAATPGRTGKMWRVSLGFYLSCWVSVVLKPLLIFWIPTWFHMVLRLSEFRDSFNDLQHPITTPTSLDAPSRKKHSKTTHHGIWIQKPFHPLHDLKQTWTNLTERHQHCFNNNTGALLPRLAQVCNRQLDRNDLRIGIFVGSTLILLANNNKNCAC